MLSSHEIALLDFPGTYSLSGNSLDERIAIQGLLGSHLPQPHLTLCVVDSTRLQRSLFLCCQIADLGLPMILALNFIDEAKAKGWEIDIPQLSHHLGIPVIPICARTGEGIESLLTTLTQCLLPHTSHASDTASPPNLQMHLPCWPTGLDSAIQALGATLQPYCATPPTTGQLRRALFDHHLTCLNLDPHVFSLKQQKRLLIQIDPILESQGISIRSLESLTYYQFLHKILKKTIVPPEIPKKNLSEQLDRILTHRIWGLGLFAVFMFLGFQSIYTLAIPIRDLLEQGFDFLEQHAHTFLTSVPLFQSLICNGILPGVGGVVLFLPQIFLLFLFIAILEDTGYIARAAFLMDKLFGWCGLNGKSFVPLLSSYACAVPALLATRTIEDPRARLATLLIAPLMSCSARLPLYLLLIGTFIQPLYGTTIASLALFGIQMLGLIVALPIAWILSHWVLKVPIQSFVLEMPPYRLPVLKDVLWRMGLAGKEFLKRAGTLILCLSIVIWALLTFPHQDQAVASDTFTQKSAFSPPPIPPQSQSYQLEHSYLGQVGKWIEPLFWPAGFNWKITVGILASFPARELMVSTLNIIYELNDSDQLDLKTASPSSLPERSTSLAQALQEERWSTGPRSGQPLFTLPTALALMVFFAFCMQCSSTLVVLSQEAGWKYALFTFLYMTTLAWVGAVMTYQITTLLFRS